MRLFYKTKKFMGKKIAVAYTPKGGNTEVVAKLIEKKLGSEHCDLLLVTDLDETLIKKYDIFIFGVSTIGTHTWKDDNSNYGWSKFLPTFRNFDFNKKTVAIYGLGNQIAYSNHFVDDMRIIYNIATANQAKIIGSWSTEGYDFQESESLINDEEFLGLAIDNDHQKHLTQERVNNWIEKILKEI